MDTQKIKREPTIDDCIMWLQVMREAWEAQAGEASPEATLIGTILDAEKQRRKKEEDPFAAI